MRISKNIQLKLALKELMKEIDSAYKQIDNAAELADYNTDDDVVLETANQALSDAVIRLDQISKSAKRLEKMADGYKQYSDKDSFDAYNLKQVEKLRQGITTAKEILVSELEAVFGPEVEALPEKIAKTTHRAKL